MRSSWGNASFATPRTAGAAGRQILPCACAEEGRRGGPLPSPASERTHRGGRGGMTAPNSASPQRRHQRPRGAGDSGGGCPCLGLSGGWGGAVGPPPGRADEGGRAGPPPHPPRPMELPRGRWGARVEGEREAGRGPHERKHSRTRAAARARQSCATARSGGGSGLGPRVAVDKGGLRLPFFCALEVGHRPTRRLPSTSAQSLSNINGPPRPRSVRTKLITRNPSCRGSVPTELGPDCPLSCSKPPQGVGMESTTELQKWTGMAPHPSQTGTGSSSLFLGDVGRLHQLCPYFFRGV